MQNEKDKLKDKTNFLGWYKSTVAELKTKGLANLDEKMTLTIIKEKENEALQCILPTISYNAMAAAPLNGSAEQIIEYFKKKWGHSNKLEARNTLFNHKMIGIDPNDYLDGLDKALGNLTIAGGNIQPEDEAYLILRSINQDFYSGFIRDSASKIAKAVDVNKALVDDIKEEMVSYWKNTPATTKDKFTAKKAKRQWEDRSCTLCAEQRPKLSKTHDTAYCRFREKENSNKPSKTYLDTGANGHFFKDKPDKMKEDTGHVGIADGTQLPIIGSGTKTIDELKLDDVKHVPALDSNLVSGTKLMNDGYTLTLQKRSNGPDVEITKNNKLVATGNLNSENLIELSNRYALLSEPKANKTVSLTEHKRLGHFGTPDEPCPLCLEHKRRKRNIPHQQNQCDLPLEIVEMDLQGPFRTPDLNGYKYNLKLVDHKTGYTKVEPIPSKEPSEILKIFKRYKTRMENKTGHRIKFVRTDSGNEFYGEFLTYLEQEGITKQKGIPYEHHVPSKCERMHQTLLGSGRVMLMESGLPEKYYHEAIQAACYIWNRLGTPSPHEQMYGKKPLIDHIHPFGSIGYAYIPKERRSKLESTRQKCRLIGFGDDDDTEEIKGYKILIETPELQVSYSNDVIFTEEKPTRITDYEDENAEQNDSGEYSPLYTPNIEDNENSGETLMDATEHTLDEVETADSSSQSNNPDTSISQDEVQEETEDPNEIFYDANEIANETSDIDQNDTLDERNCPDINDPSRVDPSHIIGDLHERTLRNRAHLIYLAYQDGKPTPKTMTEALNSDEKDNWNLAMNEELDSLNDLNVILKLSDTPPAEKTIKTRWVFSKKADMVGNYLKHKARLVGKGYMEVEGVDYEESTSFVLKFKTLRIILAIAAQYKWNVFQDDVKTAFLHAPLKTPKWIQLPNGKYALIQKALYGLKEANREWYEELKSFMKSLGFKTSDSDPCLFFKKNCIIGVYVDDTLITGDDTEIKNFRHDFATKYPLNPTSKLSSLYLGLEIEQTNGKILVSQQQYIKQKLDKYSQFLGTQKCIANPLVNNFQELLISAEASTDTEPLFPYRQMVGSLMYAMVGTRFDIASAVSIVSRYLDKPKKIHCDMVRRIFWYLRGSSDYKLTYAKSTDFKLTGYVDSSFANLENYASLSGYAFQLGDSLISWNSSRQPVIALSTAEAEYIALTPAIQEVIWLKQILSELGHPQECPNIYEDNQACILLAKNPQDHKRTRHIQLRFHWIRTQLQDKVCSLQYCSTRSQRADMFTKGLFGPALRSHCEHMGLIRYRALSCRRRVKL